MMRESKQTQALRAKVNSLLKAVEESLKKSQTLLASRANPAQQSFLTKVLQRLAKVKDQVNNPSSVKNAYVSYQLLKQQLAELNKLGDVSKRMFNLLHKKIKTPAVAPVRLVMPEVPNTPVVLQAPKKFAAYVSADVNDAYVDMRVKLRESFENLTTLRKGQPLNSAAILKPLINKQVDLEKKFFEIEKKVLAQKSPLSTQQNQVLHKYCENLLKEITVLKTKIELNLIRSVARAPTERIDLNKNKPSGGPKPK